MELTILLTGFTLVLRTVLTIASENHLCTLEEFHRCMNSLQSVAQANDLAFATSRQELVTVCKTLQESILCVDDHMERCFEFVQIKVFNDVVAGARQVIDELCIEGPIQQSFLKHAICFKNISLKVDKCAPLYQEILRLSERVDGEQDVNDGLRKHCCSFRSFIHCKYEHMSLDCGHEAGEFLREHLERMSGQLLNEHCAGYTYGSESCSNKSGRNEGRFLSISIILVIALLLSK